MSLVMIVMCVALIAGSVDAGTIRDAAASKALTAKADAAFECRDMASCSFMLSSQYFTDFGTITTEQNGTDLKVLFHKYADAHPGMEWVSMVLQISYTPLFGEPVEIYLVTRDLSDIANDDFEELVDLSPFDIPSDACLTYNASVTVRDPISSDDLGSDALLLPDSVEMKVIYPSTGDPSYFQTEILTGGPDIEGVYDGWCVDTSRTIGNNTVYTAEVYSSYDDLADWTGIVDKPENLDKVNWIINQGFVGQDSPKDGPYNYCDVQKAIWYLVDDNPSYPCNSANGDRVNEILAQANASGEAFLPGCGQSVAVILVPKGLDGSTTSNQVTIAQVTLIDDAAPCRVEEDISTLEFCCCLDGELGCTRTQGYWKTHATGKKADPAWESLGPDSTFFQSEMSYLEVMKAPSRGGNVYFILAQQYIAAKLNVISGAWPEVGATIAEAEALFRVAAPEEAEEFSQEVRANWLGLAETLDAYNNGYLSVPHCD